MLTYAIAVKLSLIETADYNTRGVSWFRGLGAIYNRVIMLTYAIVVDDVVLDLILFTWKELHGKEFKAEKEN